MKYLNAAATILILSLIFSGTALPEESLQKRINLKGIKLGFGFDRGFGVTGSWRQFNGFVGNDGVAVDYIFKKQEFKSTDPNFNVKGPLFFYVGGGGYVDWDGDFGARLPVGGEYYFAENLDVYVQLIPRLRFNHDAKFGLGAGLGMRYRF